MSEVGKAMKPLLADRVACIFCEVGGRTKMLFIADTGRGG